MWKKMNFGLYLTPFKKINLKWILDLNIRARTIKFVEESIEEKTSRKRTFTTQ